MWLRWDAHIVAVGCRIIYARFLWPFITGALFRRTTDGRPLVCLSFWRELLGLSSNCAMRVEHRSHSICQLCKFHDCWKITRFSRRVRSIDTHPNRCRRFAIERTASSQTMTNLQTLLDLERRINLGLNGEKSTRNCILMQQRTIRLGTALYGSRVEVVLLFRTLFVCARTENS